MNCKDFETRMKNFAAGFVKRNSTLLGKQDEELAARYRQVLFEEFKNLLDSNDLKGK